MCIGYGDIIQFLEVCKFVVPGGKGKAQGGGAGTCGKMHL